MCLSCKQIKIMNMKKYLIALSAFTIFTLSVNAQTKRNNTDDVNIHHHGKMEHKNRHHEKGMRMKQLNLSDAQKQQAKSLKENYKTQYKQLEENKNSMSQQDYQSKKEQIRKEQRLKFESILTADQKAKIKDLRKDQKAKREGMQSKKMDRMKSNLSLSDDQVSKMQNHHETFKAQAKAIKENNSLTDEQKKENLMDLRKRSQEDEKTILTAEQLQKKEALKKNRMHEMKNKRTEKS